LSMTSLRLVSLFHPYKHIHSVLIRAGGSASAAGTLVEKLGGKVTEYIFILELDFLKGRDKLNAPVYTLLSGQEEKLGSK
jgi:adenine phosphoribosyltransferase